MRHLETEIAVVGAGLIGMAIALELADRGRLVHVLDRAPAQGAEASGAGAGMIAGEHEADAPGPFLDLCLDARDMWMDMAPRLARDSGIDPQHRADGFLYLALDDPEWDRLRRRADWQESEGLPLQRLSPLETADRFPMVTRSIAGALFYPGEHHLHTGRTVEAYAGACRSAGVTFLFSEEVRELLVEGASKGTRISGVHTDGLHVAAEHTVLAAGAWTGRLTAALGAPLPVEPVRGQIAVARGVAAPPKCLVGSSKGYIVPRDGGELLAGATSEHAGFDRTTTEEGVSSVWENAVRLLPGLEGTRPAESWAGLRPGTPDGLPILGPIPGFASLWIATGHYRNGILLAPLTGRLMANWITGGEPGLDPAPFLPDRFLF